MASYRINAFICHQRDPIFAVFLSATSRYPILLTPLSANRGHPIFLVHPYATRWHSILLMPLSATRGILSYPATMSTYLCGTLICHQMAANSIGALICHQRSPGGSHMNISFRTTLSLHQTRQYKWHSHKKILFNTNQQ